MKATLIALLLSALLNPFSYNKDKTAAKSVVGVWTGTYTVDQLPDMPPHYYKFTIKKNGKLTTEGTGGDDGVMYHHKGTWELKGDLFTATYTTLNPRGLPVTQKATMTLNSEGKFTDATWTDVTNPHGHLDGKFQNLVRVD
jgi:hypothetical protein